MFYYIFKKIYIHDFSRFFMFYSISWMIFYHILFKNHSCFINDFHKIFKIFQDFSGFFRIFQDFSGFFMFYQDLEWYLITFLRKIYSSFINDFDKSFKIFQDFSGIFKIFQDFFLHFIFVHHFTMIKSRISPYNSNYLKVWTFHCCMHSLEIQCIQQWI